VSQHLDKCKLAARTVRAYKRQAAAYVIWLAANAGAHGDAFADLVGGAVSTVRHMGGAGRPDQACGDVRGVVRQPAQVRQDRPQGRAPDARAGQSL
jgi:hypothetical protein